MGRTRTYTVAYDDGAACVDLCKVIFGGDGSYYVTAPFHPHDRAIAARMTVNYADDGPRLFSLHDAIESGVVDDDDRRLKLAHHPDDFLQFSGAGIRSGLDDTGKPRGIGTFSWPLARPTLGPSFAISFARPVECGRPSKQSAGAVVFREADIDLMRGPSISGLRLVGYYLPTPWREFVWRDGDDYFVNLVHPAAQTTLRLRAVLAPKESDMSGLIGLQAVPHGFTFVGDVPGFAVTSSTGHLRRNDKGELLGDQLICMYPSIDADDVNAPSLMHPLPSPAYKAPPGSGV